MKRTLDIVLSLLALLLLSPLLLAAAIAIGARDGWPILFAQRRIGLHGHEFLMYKFRTMVRDAAAIGPHHTAAGDPRITRVGRFLRRSSIDELPQLFNVLRGDMSLVGPRPDVAAQRPSYTEAQWRERCSVRPGITGLAQVTYRSEATQAQRLTLDLQYVRERRLMLDLSILVRTLGRLMGHDSN